MYRHAYYLTIKELAAAGRDNIPADLQYGTQLIYSSPATLAYNSPGAQGFGVKRAGLAVPGSVMLLVSPGCCGRNTAALDEPAYRDRFFYLLQDENDIVTGRHLRLIPEAVEKICRALPYRPSVVMLCITCVDALLGTDMERVCRKAEARVGIPVRPCYMYALTRESRKPPMVAVRQTVYSLLEPRPKQATMVNLLGYFAPLQDSTELYDILRQLGLQYINEISRCRDFAAYQEMACANFNLILHPEARFAAQDMEQRLNIPSIELVRLYQLDKLRNQYRILAQLLGGSITDEQYYDIANQAIDAFCQRYGSKRLAVGSVLNANSFELALALAECGLQVSEIYSSVTADDFAYIRRLAVLSPATKVYTNLSPTMLNYDLSASRVDMTIGKDAAYYHPQAVNVPWNEERQPFGYAGVQKLFARMYMAAEEADV